MKKKPVKTIGGTVGTVLVLLIIVLARTDLLSGDGGAATDTPRSERPARTLPTLGSGDTGIDEIRSLFEDGRSGVIVEATGRVRKTLPDDNEGSRHQRFIVELAPDLTVLVSHNIDLAPRVPLEEGDTVGFKGEYEWNEQGGVVHWTHHDPRGRHEDGWIRHRGSLYQ